MKNSAWRVESTPPDHPVAALLIDELSAELAERYKVVWPSSDGRTNYVPADFDPTTDAFLVGYAGHDPACCGALRRFGDATVEIKRMYVRPDHRGSGLGRWMLDALEGEAARLGYSAIVLETGSEQPEAIGLYASGGYELVAPWPPYDERPYARCFGKDLRQRSVT
jgi:GNAT superfamily N-acetyltransferase